MQNLGNVVVVGGGIAGLTVALDLAQRGIHVTLLERTSSLGGRSVSVCCKAIDGRCQLCGGCLLHDRLRAVQDHPRIHTLLERSLGRLTPAGRGYHITWPSPASSDLPAQVDAVVLATGFDPVDARGKGPYGFGILPGVTTGEEMEKRLAADGQGAYDNLGLRRVAFIQCVGSRDAHVGRGYCSQVCCRYALRLARLLKSRLPELEVTIFKMDLQTNGRDMTETWSACRQEGIRVVAALPAVLRRATADPQRVTLSYDDYLAGAFVQEDFDLVVLSVGLQPRRDAADLAEALQINCDPHGFFAAGADEVSTLRPGIFLAGTCQAPRSMAESVAHAERAAEACYLYLQERSS